MSTPSGVITSISILSIEDALPRGMGYHENRSRNSLPDKQEVGNINMGFFLNLKPVEIIVSNPDKTDRFYYGKLSPHNPFPLTDPDAIKIYNTSHVTETSLDDMMKRITHRDKKIIVWSLFFSITISLLSLSFSLLFPLFSRYYSACLFPILYILLYFIFHRSTEIILLRYSLKGKKEEFYKEVIHHLSHLIFADNLWHINKVVPNRNPKDFGGVKELYHRSRVQVKKARPFFIDTNIIIYSISYGYITIFFLPDCILVQQRRKFSYYYYTDLFLYFTEKPSLEKKNPPGDARVIGYRWLHPNKDGSRDRRYKHNPKIPLLLFSEFLIYFKGGFQTYFQISNSRITLAFFTFLSSFAEVAHKRPYLHKTIKRNIHRGNEQKEENEQPAGTGGSQNKEEGNHFKKTAHNSGHTQQSKQLDNTTIKAFRLFGVLPGTPMVDIKRNYRALVKRYHPDLFARKNELMKKFADKKIREINKAYSHLVKWFSPS